MPVRSATDEDLELLFGSGRLVIGFPVTPNESTPPSSPPAGDDHSTEVPDELRVVRGPLRVSPDGGEWEIHLRRKPSPEPQPDTTRHPHAD
jgi:hypothetical protein